MSICVQIQLDDDGNVEVGICPPGEQSEEGGEHMQPVESIDVALAKAKAFLGGRMPSVPKPKNMQEAMFPAKPESDAKAAKKA